MFDRLSSKSNKPGSTAAGEAESSEIEISSGTIFPWVNLVEHNGCEWVVRRQRGADYGEVQQIGASQLGVPSQYFASKFPTFWFRSTELLEHFLEQAPEEYGFLVQYLKIALSFKDLHLVTTDDDATRLLASLGVCDEEIQRLLEDPAQPPIRLLAREIPQRRAVKVPLLRGDNSAADHAARWDQRMNYHLYQWAKHLAQKADLMVPERFPTTTAEKHPVTVNGRLIQLRGGVSHATSPYRAVVQLFNPEGDALGKPASASMSSNWLKIDGHLPSPSDELDVALAAVVPLTPFRASFTPADQAWESAAAPIPIDVLSAASTPRCA